MPRISVVVPIYNVERYLAACLDSVARQSVTDLEVVMVNDGSADGSRAIAEVYAEQDRRFRLVDQDNAGLSAARNTGIDVADGEFLAFLDSDDVLAANAYELLLGALDKTGSDFATGNVHRLTAAGTTQAPFLAKTFARTKLRTHVTRFRPLIADRVAWNKLWRRSFWDRHGYRFPEGRLHEDIPIVVPAHFAARSVDVISDPIYYWRIRADGELSITQRRLEPRVLLDRLAVIKQVSRQLAENGPRRAQRWYDDSVVADDLALHLNVLDRADDDYRRLFMDQVNLLLDGTSPRAFRRLTAIDRLKWHLVRRRQLPELLEVLRFQAQELDATPPVRLHGSWYGDYPFRDDPRLGIPRSVYKLGKADLPGAAHVDELRREGTELKLRGFAYIAGIGAPAPGSQRVRVLALPPGRLARLRLRIKPLRLKTVAIRRPDATAPGVQPLNDLSWAGYEATLDPRSLRRRHRRGDGSWELYVVVSAGRIRRRRARFVTDPARPLRAVQLPAGEDAMLLAAPTQAAGVNVELLARSATVEAFSPRDEGLLELAGTLRPARSPGAELELRRRADAVVRTFPLLHGENGSPRSFRASVQLDDPTAYRDGGVRWQLSVVDATRRLRVLLSDDTEGAAWRRGAREVALVRTPRGDAALVERSPRPIVTGARWTDDGRLELEGESPHPVAALVLRRCDGIEEHALPLRQGNGGFAVTVHPARIDSPGGVLPLSKGLWRLSVLSDAASGRADEVPLCIAGSMQALMPIDTVVGEERFAFAVSAHECATVVVEPARP